VVKTVKLASGADFKIKLWDCSGQERFRNISKFYLNKASGCIIVFSLDSAESLKCAELWIDSVSQIRKEGKQIQIVLVANKCDLPADQIEITDWKSRGCALAAQLSDSQYTVPFIHADTKTGKNIEKPFVEMATALDNASVMKSPTPSSNGGGCWIL